MSVLFFLIKSWMIGIAIAAPVGPIGMLCIRKTLELGFVGAVAVGLGAATADIIYGIIAATGLTAVSHFLLEKVVFIKILGGAFLLYLAYKEIKSKPSTTETNIGKNKKLYQLTSKVFFLTLTNPMTILSFIGIFASMSGDIITTSESVAMVIGLFLGSMTWWLILGSIVIKIKHRLPEAWIHRIRYLSAMILAGFGAYIILAHN